MIMIYKVYAQNVKKADPVQKIDIDDVKELIEEHVSSLLDSMSFDEIDIDDDNAFEKVYDALCSLLEEHFEKYKYIGCGDFDILVSDSIPSRPCKADNTFFEEKEIIDFMNRN